jgi:hypothetical protein
VISFGDRPLHFITRLKIGLSAARCLGLAVRRLPVPSHIDRAACDLTFSPLSLSGDLRDLSSHLSGEWRVAISSVISPFPLSLWRGFHHQAAPVSWAPGRTEEVQRVWPYGYLLIFLLKYVQLVCL